MDFGEFQRYLKGTLGEIYSTLSEAQLNQFNGLFKALCEGSRRMNLTAILDAKGVAEKHFGDSLLPVKHGLLQNCDRVIDIGSGAGLPGLPLKTVRPDLDITLLDATEKKTVFIKETAEACGLDVHVICARAEEAAQDNIYRERYNVSVSRAVARLDILLELCAGFVKQGGAVIAYKGEKAAAEIKQAAQCAQTLGFKLEGVFESESGADSHCVVVYRKQKATDKKYPRAFAQIKKRPL